MNGSLHLHLPAQSSGATSVVIDRAVAFARRLEAQLEISISTLDTPHVSHWASEHFSAAVLDVETGSRIRATELTATARAACKAAQLAPVITQYDVTSLGLDRRIALTSRAHDITILGLSDGDGDTRRIVEALAFASGRPVMILPASRPVTLDFDRIAVAWDHSEAAARAVAFAMPLLKRAQHVDVITVTSAKLALVRDPGASAVAHLRAHGIAAEVRTLQALGRKIGPLIQEEAIRRRAGLLVMGAYNTPRAQELIFGGVTKSLLAKPELPLFIAN
jgi:nucleotide-binding universal stress UspA family protein